MQRPGWLALITLLGCAVPGGDGPQDLSLRVPLPDLAPEAIEGVVVPADRWSRGPIGDALPPKEELLPLPGRGAGGPLVISSNPEVFTGDGLLYGTARPSPTRGGRALALQGDFGVYLRHSNRSGAPRHVTVLISNAATESVTLSGRGSGYPHVPGEPGPGADPGHRVSDEWIRHRPTTVLPDTRVAPGGALILFQGAVDDGAAVEGRFALRTSGPVHVEVVASRSAVLAEVQRTAQSDAPGSYRVAGDPPPPLGRAAGVYAHDTWRGVFTVAVPPPGWRIGFLVNTATGSGHPQVQAFPALVHYDRSARESAGMHGNVYDLAFYLRSAGPDGPPRRVRLLFCSYAQPADPPSWQGVALVSGGVVALYHAGAERCTVLGEHPADAVTPALLRFQAMVPGVASLPQALLLESR